MTEKFLNSLGQSAKSYGIPALLASLTTGGINAYLASESNPINETPSQRRRRLLKAFIQPAGITAALATALGVGKAIYDVNLSDVLTDPNEKYKSKLRELINNGYVAIKDKNGNIIFKRKEDIKDSDKTITARVFNRIGELGGNVIETFAEDPVKGALQGGASIGGTIAADRAINKGVDKLYSKAQKKIDQSKENIRDQKALVSVSEKRDLKANRADTKRFNKYLSKVNRLQDKMNFKKSLVKGIGRTGNAFVTPVMLWNMLGQYKAFTDPTVTGNEIDENNLTNEQRKAIVNIIENNENQ